MNSEIDMNPHSSTEESLSVLKSKWNIEESNIVEWFGPISLSLYIWNSARYYCFYYYWTWRKEI